MGLSVAIFLCVGLGDGSLNSSCVGESFAIGHQYFGDHFCDASEMRCHVNNASVDSRRIPPGTAQLKIEEFLTLNRKFASLIGTLLKVRIHSLYERLASIAKCIRSNGLKVAILKSKPAPG